MCFCVCICVCVWTSRVFQVFFDHTYIGALSAPAVAKKKKIPESRFICICIMCVCVYVCVCVCVCVCLCVCVCVCEREIVCMCVFVYLYVYVCGGVECFSTYIGVCYVCAFRHTLACVMCVYLCACVCVRERACMCVLVSLHLYICGRVKYFSIIRTSARSRPRQWHTHS